MTEFALLGAFDKV